MTQKDDIITAETEQEIKAAAAAVEQSDSAETTETSPSKPIVTAVDLTGDTSEEAITPSQATKAGKRSPKAQREAEADATRKHKASQRDEQPKSKPKPSQPNLLKLHGKKYRQLAKQIEPNKIYDLTEAITLAKATSPVKFDASVELHINLGVDPRQADQMVRGSVVLPAGTGKSVRVAVIAQPDKQADAKAAGADLIGEDDIIKQIEQGQINFDVLIATPQVMSKLGKLAKVLGPKGLMPNPKSGTVTANVGEAVQTTKAGRVEFRIDKQAIVHQAIGKVSFSAADLEKNATSFVQAVMNAKPTGAKGVYVKRMSLATTMGPAIKLNHTQTIATANQAK